VVLRRKTRAL